MVKYAVQAHQEQGVASHPENGFLARRCAGKKKKQQRTNYRSKREPEKMPMRGHHDDHRVQRSEGEMSGVQFISEHNQ